MRLSNFYLNILFLKIILDVHQPLAWCFCKCAHLSCFHHIYLLRSHSAPVNAQTDLRHWEPPVERPQSPLLELQLPFHRHNFKWIHLHICRSVYQPPLYDIVRLKSLPLLPNTSITIPFLPPIYTPHRHQSSSLITPSLANIKSDIEKGLSSLFCRMSYNVWRLDGYPEWWIAFPFSNATSKPNGKLEIGMNISPSSLSSQLQFSTPRMTLRLTHYFLVSITSWISNCQMVFKGA